MRGTSEHFTLVKSLSGIEMQASGWIAGLISVNVRAIS